MLPEIAVHTTINIKVKNKPISTFTSFEANRIGTNTVTGLRFSNCVQLVMLVEYINYLIDVHIV